MFKFVLKRIASAVGVVLALTVVLFILQKASNTNPVHAILGPNASAAAVKAETIKLGLNRPLLAQLFSYIGNLLQFNLGTSYRTRRPVSTDLAQYPCVSRLRSYRHIRPVSLQNGSECSTFHLLF